MALICGAELVVPNQSQCNDGSFLSRTIAFNCGRCLSSAVLTTFRMDGVGYQRQWRVVRRRLASYGAANADPEESTEESVEDPEERTKSRRECKIERAVRRPCRSRTHERGLEEPRTQRVHTANPHSESSTHTNVFAYYKITHTHTGGEQALGSSMNFFACVVRGSVICYVICL